MSSLASKMFGSEEEGLLEYGSDINQITEKLENLHEEMDLSDAFKALVQQQPSITEDLPSLTNISTTLL